MKSFNIGGVERSVINYANELIKDFDYVGICAYGDFFNHKNYINDDVEINNLPFPSNSSNFLSNLFCIIKILKKKEITILHYHHRVYLPYILILRVRFPALKIIYSHHNTFDDQLTKLLYANHYVAISKSTESELIRSHKKDFTIIKHGTPISYNEVSQQLKEKFTIGFVGRFTKTKGIFVLLDAFRNIHIKLSHVRLCFFGEGELQESIESFIREHHFQKVVDIFPPTTNLESIYSRIDLLVIPSISLEGFGLVIIEGMAHKKLVVASDLPVFREIITDEETGFLFTAGDSKHLEKVLLKIISDDELYNKIRLNGFDTAVREYNLSDAVNKYINLYKRCWNSGKYT